MANPLIAEDFFKAPSYYTKWLLHVLRQHIRKNAPMQTHKEFDRCITSMRKNIELRPESWEQRFFQAQDNNGVDPEFSYYILQGLVACAFSVASEREQHLPEPNRAWEYAATAMWWGGLFGGGQDRFDQMEVRRRTNIEKAAAVRHAETRAMQAEARKWYESRRSTMSKDKAAEMMAGKIFPVSFRTVRGWLKDSTKTRG
ncbi:MAG: hypothetical protein IPJ08_07505 [Burkholderiales bacterium]|nr:hypothetical protein [Burkholderiales bacterium]